jgi:hypothetical protein
MATMFPPTWRPFFEGAAASTPTQPPAQRLVRRLYGGYTAGSPVVSEAGAAPPARPTLPVRLMGTPSEPPRRKREFAWTTWQMPARLREEVIVNLRQTLHWRARYCQPLPPTRTARRAHALWAGGRAVSSPGHKNRARTPAGRTTRNDSHAGNYAARAGA